MRRRDHRGGHRPSHDGGTLAVKILSPFGPKSSDRRSASGHASVAGSFGPFDQQDSVGGRVEAQFLDLGRILDPIKIDMPDWRVEFLIGLDDREARARHFADMAERGEETACQCGLARLRAGPTV